jgi:hypothetical protein
MKKAEIKELLKSGKKYAKSIRIGGSSQGKALKRIMREERKS